MIKMHLGSTDFKSAYIKYLKEPIYRHGKVFPRFRGVEFFEKFEDFEYTNSKLNGFNGDIWFISDHHFNHKNIIRFSERPFRDLDHMENMLVEQHNDMVKDDDIVIIVGDFGFCGTTEGKRILQRMNGYKIFIVGNHDVYHGKFKNFGYNEVYICLPLLYNDIQMIISHYPCNKFDNDLLNVHGHVHVGRTLEDGFDNHFNVNCEFINYTPIHIDKIGNK